MKILSNALAGFAFGVFAAFGWACEPIIVEFAHKHILVR